MRSKIVPSVESYWNLKKAPGLWGTTIYFLYFLLIYLLDLFYCNYPYIKKKKPQINPSQLDQTLRPAFPLWRSAFKWSHPTSRFVEACSIQIFEWIFHLNESSTRSSKDEGKRVTAIFVHVTSFHSELFCYPFYNFWFIYVSVWCKFCKNHWNRITRAKRETPTFWWRFVKCQSKYD